MTYGIEVFNKNGFIQFNSSSYACRVISSGSASVYNKVVAGYPSNFNLRYFNVPGNILGPQRRFWLKSQDTNKYFMGGYGSDYNSSDDTTAIRVEDSVPVGSVFDYTLTDYGGTDSNNGYGLVVKNPNGGVEFNSLDTQMMITSTWSYDVYEGNQSEWTTGYYGSVRVDYRYIDVPISSSPFGGRPYIFADGLTGGCIKNNSGSGNAWLMYAYAQYLNDSTLRVRLNRMPGNIGTTPPNPTYHKFTIIAGVVR